MMKRHWIFVFALILGMVGADAPAQAGMEFKDPAVDYAADQIVTAEGQQIASRVYHSPKKIRMEMQGTVIITRMDKNVSWMIIPEMSAYQEFTGEQQGRNMQHVDLYDSQVEMTPMGTETIHGVQATKHKATITDAQGNRSEGYLWISKEGIMVKGIFQDPSAGTEPVVIELKNLVLGPQDPALFELPSGVSKMPAFGAPGALPMSGAGQGRPDLDFEEPPELDDEWEAQQREPQQGSGSIMKNVQEGVDTINKLKGLFGN